MNKAALSLLSGLVVASVAGSVRGDVVQVTVTGVLQYNKVPWPPLSDPEPGALATMTFQVDSNVFTDSRSFPLRGYEIDPASFSFTVGATTIGLGASLCGGPTPYFVIRDNDPFVDGFLVTMNLDFPEGLPLDQMGVFCPFEVDHGVVYSQDRLDSLDVLDALGTYDLTGLIDWDFMVGDGPFVPVMGLVFEQMTIESVAECFLVVGDEPGVTPWAPNGHVFWPQVSGVREYYPVTMADIPRFVLPEPRPTPFRGGTLFADYADPFAVQTWTVQVLMWNPDVFPDLPEQYTSGLQAFVLPGGRVLSRPYGDAQNMEISARVERNEQGQVVLSFPFTIDGF